MSLVLLHTCCSRALRTVGKALGSSEASAQESKHLFLSLLELPNLHRLVE